MARSRSAATPRSPMRGPAQRFAPRMRPALFAGFGDLTTLRYDFPLVLTRPGDDGPFVEALSGRVDSLLGAIAPAGSRGERLRRAILGVEREIRAEVSRSGGRSLESTWDAGAERLIGSGDALLDDLAQAREAMPLDGELVGCDRALPARFVRHAWRQVQEHRRRDVLTLIERLESALAGLVRADFLRSAVGREAAQLRAGMVTTQQSLFDFDAMAQLLARPSGLRGLSDARRRRIDEILATLRDQRPFGDGWEDDFTFANIDKGLRAYHARLTEMAIVVRAIALAELETQDRVIDTGDELLLGRIGTDRAWPNDLRLFPDHLVCIDAGAPNRTLSDVLAALASGVALKVLVAIDDPFGFGGRLAEAAMGLGDVFVVQTAASHLYQARDRVIAALEYAGPALLAVYTPPSRLTDGGSSIPEYLVSAAAVESRAVPGFSYDPRAGAGWAQRFSLDFNPQAERPWPKHELSCSDHALQRVTQEIAFTAADFALCDARSSAYFSAPTPDQADALVPIDAWPADGAHRADAAAPFVYAYAGASGTLQKLVVDERLVHLTQLRSEAWSRLCELDAVKLEHGGAAGEGEIGSASTAPVVIAESVSVATASADADTDGASEESAEGGADGASPAALGGDDPYIETPRCTTCNECTGVNSRMFAYNENRQAYIADPDAGTYRELVEAAERCQVAIIHPGKPRNPTEPGIEALLERAAPFAS